MIGFNYLFILIYIRPEYLENQSVRINNRVDKDNGILMEFRTLALNLRSYTYCINLCAEGE